MRRCTRLGKATLMALGCCAGLLAAAWSNAEQPLSKEDIASLLRSRSSSEKVIALVEQRGVSFRVDPDIAKELHDAGASDEVIEAIQKVGGSVVTPPPGVLKTPPATVQPAPSPAQAQTPAPGTPAQLVPAADADAIELPAGTTLGLELQDNLNSKFTKKGDRAEFKVSPGVQLGGRIAIPQDAGVKATIVRAKGAGRGGRKGELQLEFNQIVLANGETLPLAAKLIRAGQWNRSAKITAVSDRDLSEDVLGMAQWGVTGALIGGLSAKSGKGAAIGAGAGIAVAALALLLQRGPELDLPPGLMFQVELTKPLKIPLASTSVPLMAGGNSPLPAPPQAPEPVVQNPTSGPSAPVLPPPDANTTAHVETASVPAATVAAISIPQPSPVPAASTTTLMTGQEAIFKLSVDVNLVMLDATVRDDRGVIYIKLKREDFRVLEDGVEQEVRHFSRDELPLAVAVVIDRSGSVAPVMDRLRRAAYETLSQLKAGDQVALFAFAETPELIEPLTTNRQVISDGIAKIKAGGGTNIKDSLFEAAEYLTREAPGRRRAIILISDNQETVSSRVDESQVVRMALEAESAVYSIKVEDRSPLAKIAQPLPMSLGAAVKKITQETGGEIFETKKMGSVESAMQAVISRLKLRFTLGYQSTNTRRDGSYRKIDVRLTDKQLLTRGFTVYSRRGYYAPKPGPETFPPPSAETLSTTALPVPATGQPAVGGSPGKTPGKSFTNEDVLKLVKAGFAEETILQAIRTNEPRFDTSADALLALKNAGVSEKIITAMLNAGRVQ